MNFYFYTLLLLLDANLSFNFFLEMILIAIKKCLVFNKIHLI